MIKLVFIFITIVLFQGYVKCDVEIPENPTIVEDLGASREGSRTDENLMEREEQRIKLDGLSLAQIKALKESSENFHYQADVTRMMKIIINSLYQNKEIFLRELISNASDALDKIRMLSLTADVLKGFEELDIKIKADKENNILQITDTGIGMTKNDLVQNLGTLAKSGTSEFMKEMAKGTHQASDLIGQFGVGFYSTFLVADKVVVVSKHNDDDQYIWESDAENFSIVKDPRGNTLQRGTQINLHLKEEAHDFLEEKTLKELIKKYSQFINFNIYLWEKSIEKVEEPVEEEKKAEEKKSEDEDDEAKVEEEKEIKTNTVEKTVWDWKLMNGAKPIWTRKPSEVDDKEYDEFYKTIAKESEDPLAHIHFTAEGEVTFKSILYIGKTANTNMFSEYGKKVDHIRLYVRRVFITSDFEDMMPKYLAFVFGIVDSDDLPLNVSRETLQQNKLLKVIKKKLIRKVLDMIKKLSEIDFQKFWKEYSTNIKLGIIEDASNRNRLAKLVRFYSSFNETEPSSLASYVERMKDKQDVVYFIAGQSMAEVKNSPFVERLLKKGYEVLYLTEPIDEYCIQALPEFEGKKFQNVAKEGLKMEEGKKNKENQEVLEKKFETLTSWLKDSALSNSVEKVLVSQRLFKSPLVLVAQLYGWDANMERIMKSSTYAKSNDPNNDYYANMKKTLEINPRHPLIKELLKRVEEDKEDSMAKDMAGLLFDTATLRSGYGLKDTKGFAERIERMMKKGFNLGDVEVEEELEEFEEPEEDDDDEGEDKDDQDEKEDKSLEDEKEEEEALKELKDEL